MKRKLLPVLFSIYLLFSVCVLVFKLNFSIDDMVIGRQINWIPFYAKQITNVSSHIREIILNVIVFIPFGIYISMLQSHGRALNKILPVFLTSLIFEIAQLVLSIGIFDVTDLITNTLGGISGIVLYGILVRLFNNKQKADSVLTFLALAGTTGMLILTALLLIANK